MDIYRYVYIHECICYCSWSHNLLFQNKHQSDTSTNYTDNRRTFEYSEKCIKYTNWLFIKTCEISKTFVVNLSMEMQACLYVCKETCSEMGGSLQLAGGVGGAWSWQSIPRVGGNLWKLTRWAESLRPCALQAHLCYGRCYGTQNNVM